MVGLEPHTPDISTAIYHLTVHQLPAKYVTTILPLQYQGSIAWNARYMFIHTAKAVEISATYEGNIIERLIFAGEELLNIHADALQR